VESARRARVLERFATIRETLEGNGWKQAFEDRDREDRDELGILNLSYFDFGLPCPFLEDESCSIHPYRPSICREYLVTTPAERCFEISRPGVQVHRLPVGVWLSRSLARLAARLLGRGEMELIPLTSALDWAREHREEGQRRFPARALLEGLLEELGPARDPEPPSTSSA
jgi:Putative zinc- or iron-chelating domain